MATPLWQEQPDERRVYSVARFNRGLAGYLDRMPNEFHVEGELSELSRNDRWAHVYLTLKDPELGSTLRVTMLRRAFERLEQAPALGESVLVTGRPRLNERDGSLSFACRAIERRGDGGLLAEIERRRERLAAAGLFAEARKRPLPFWPKVVGIVGGRDAAASRDVTENALRRFPPARFLVAEAPVQGPSAVPGLIAALRRLDADPDVEVIVLTRGGGSVEDLLPFSDERLCHAIAACATPIVSAVGHERDTPLCDLVADVRASTPTAAAKLVVPDHAELVADLERMRGGARRCVGRALADAERSLAALAARPALRRPEHWLETRRDALARARGRLDVLPRAGLTARSASLDALRARLLALAPSATLERGYAIVLGPDRHVVADAAVLAPDDAVELVLGRGRAGARIEEVHPDG